MKILYDFDCHCCIDDIEISVPDDATEEEIELAIFRDIIDRYALDLNWRKELSLDERITAAKQQTDTGRTDSPEHFR